MTAFCLQVCAIDTGDVHYTDKYKTTQHFETFEMGCEVAYLCRDGVTYGPGPFGYSRKKRECCCSDKCLIADGTGSGDADHCPHSDAAFKALAPGLRVETLSLGLTILTCLGLIVWC